MKSSISTLRKVIREEIARNLQSPRSFLDVMSDFRHWEGIDVNITPDPGRGVFMVVVTCEDDDEPFRATVKTEDEANFVARDAATNFRNKMLNKEDK